MKNFKIKKNESGRSMIEMLGVLAIIGVLSVGGIAGYSKAMMKYRINKTIEQITLIAGNVRTFFAPQRSYDSASNFTVLKKAKIVPNEMWTTFSDEGGSWEGIEIALGTELGLLSDQKSTSSNTPDAFVFSIDGIPQEACIEIATMDWQANSGNSIINITVNANTSQEALSQLTDSCTTNARVTCAQDLPMSIDKAATACSREDNSIYIKFY